MTTRIATTISTYLLVHLSVSRKLFYHHSVCYLCKQTSQITNFDSPLHLHFSPLLHSDHHNHHFKHQSTRYKSIKTYKTLIIFGDERKDPHPRGYFIFCCNSPRSHHSVRCSLRTTWDLYLCHKCILPRFSLFNWRGILPCVGCGGDLLYCHPLPTCSDHCWCGDVGPLCHRCAHLSPHCHHQWLALHFTTRARARVPIHRPPR